MNRSTEEKSPQFQYMTATPDQSICSADLPVQIQSRAENTNRQEVDSQISKSIKWWNLNSSAETKPHLVRICSSKIIKLSDRRNWLLAHCPIANIPQNLKVGQLCCYSLCFNDYLHSDRTTIVYVSGCPNPFPLPVTSFSNVENILDSFSLQPC